MENVFINIKYYSSLLLDYSLAFENKLKNKGEFHLFNEEGIAQAGRTPCKNSYIFAASLWNFFFFFNMYNFCDFIHWMKNDVTENYRTS